MRRREVLGVMAAGAAQAVQGAPARQTFGVDGDRFVLNGKPWVIRSGEMHYARVPREYWRDRMRKLRALEIFEPNRPQSLVGYSLNALLFVQYRGAR